MRFLTSIFPEVPPLFWNLLLLALLHVGLWAFLLSCLRGTRLHALKRSEIGYDLPRTLVVFPLQRLGHQEISSLRAVLSQDHPNYSLQIVLDGFSSQGTDRHQEHVHPSERRPQGVDLQRLADLLAEYPAIATKTLPLDPRYVPERWLKRGYDLDCFSNAAFAQVLDSCNQDPTPPDVLATVSSQLIPHGTYLRELVAPITLQGKAATTTYPWHTQLPRSQGMMARLRSLAQYAWNAFATIQMICVSQVLWNGSMAIKTSHLLGMSTLERWRKMGLTDVALGQLLVQRGHRIRFVGSLMQVRRSAKVQLPQEIFRRLGALRRHHRRWRILALRGIFVLFMHFRFLTWVVQSVSAQEFSGLRWVGAGLGCYLLAIFLLVFTTEQFVDGAEPRHSNPLPPSDLFSHFILLGFIPLTYVVQSMAIVMTLFNKRHWPQRQMKEAVWNQPDVETSIMK